MKLKVIFILFNAVILGSFLIIFFMPFIILGGDFSTTFWQKNWYLAILFVLILLAFNLFFVKNWKLFTILDREAWPDLKEYLEKVIFEKGRITNQYIRLYVQSALISGKIMEIRKLEEKVAEKRPKLIKKNVLAFGLPYMVEQKPAELLSYFEVHRSISGRDSYWVRWSYAFALLTSGKPDEASKELSLICETVNDKLVRLLSLYLLTGITGEEAEKVMIEGKEALRSSYSPEDFDAERKKQTDNYMLLALSRLIDDAKKWLYE